MCCCYCVTVEGAGNSNLAEGPYYYSFSAVEIRYAWIPLLKFPG